MKITFKETKVEDKYPIIIPYHEMMQIIHDLGESAYVLYVYYHSKGQKWAWVNKNIGKDLGWSESKVKRIKQILKDGKYLYWYTHLGNAYTYVGRLQHDIGIAEEIIEKGKLTEDQLDDLNKYIEDVRKGLHPILPE